MNYVSGVVAPKEGRVNSHTNELLKRVFNARMPYSRNAWGNWIEGGAWNIDLYQHVKIDGQIQEVLMTMQVYGSGALAFQKIVAFAGTSYVSFTIKGGDEEGAFTVSDTYSHAYGYASDRIAREEAIQG